MAIVGIYVRFLGCRIYRMLRNLSQALNTSFLLFAKRSWRSYVNNLSMIGVELLFMQGWMKGGFPEFFHSTIKRLYGSTQKFHPEHWRTSFFLGDFPRWDLRATNMSLSTPSPVVQVVRLLCAFFVTIFLRSPCWFKKQKARLNI